MALDFTIRNTQTEWMDDLDCHGEIVDQTLRELGTINKLLGGNAVTLRGLDKLISRYSISKDQVIHIADIGCGGGDMLIEIEKWADRRGIKVKLTGIDANANIVEYARKHCAAHDRISFKTANVLSPEFATEKYDIIIGILFFHHFDSECLEQLFSSLMRQASMGLVINDLHRHWFGYHSIKILTKLFSRSPMVQEDGPLSVLRGFSRNEIDHILSVSCPGTYTLGWYWAFRWLAVVSNENP